MREDAGPTAQPRPWSIRGYQPGDEVRIVGLFERVFGHARSLAHWRWKFLDNPEGAQICLAVTDTGEIIGHYSGIPVRVTADGQTLAFSQAVDVMVDAEYRQGLKKPGICAGLFQQFAKTYGGEDRVAVLWGFTTPEHLRLGQRLLGYVFLHWVMKLVRSVDTAPHPTAGRRMAEAWRRMRCPIYPVDRFDSRVDRLWEECRPELRVATVRDARYLNWRYADCPDVKYRLLMAGGTPGTRLQGMAVLRLGVGDQPVACLMDWLVPSRHMAAADRLLQHSFQEAERAGLKEVHAWFPPSSLWYRYLLGKGFQPVGTGSLTVRQFTPAVSLELLNTDWYYTMGDSDHY